RRQARTLLRAVRRGDPESALMADEKEQEPEKKQAKPKPEGGEAKPKGEGKPKGDAKAAKGGDEKGKGKGDSRKKGGKDAPLGPAVGEAEPPARIPRLREHFDKSVLPELMKRFSYKNPMEAPRLKKIVVNMGVGDALQNIKMLDAAVAEMTTITGQKPSIRKAKKSIANFKLREGQPI